MAYKKILTIQDISCVGQCSLTVAIPVAMSLSPSILTIGSSPKEGKYFSMGSSSERSPFSIRIRDATAVMGFVIDAIRKIESFLADPKVFS